MADVKQESFQTGKVEDVSIMTFNEIRQVKMNHNTCGGFHLLPNI
uniref:Uncharacterized protein n=1 Tax=Anguilla anguilla TaxID=7936 RepID=A0A0E9UR68_ANGAN